MRSYFCLAKTSSHRSTVVLKDIEFPLHLHATSAELTQGYGTDVVTEECCCKLQQRHMSCCRALAGLCIVAQSVIQI